ncbi:MAG TPA: hotdog fold thioesterase [Bacteroidia bacterium]|jgi:acyl-CoA thioesterase|nr:hotdog fold thioesterase [Bacteroidia bacterium]
MTKSEEIIKNKMYANDEFSKWLGIEIIKTGEGSCELKMKVREEMTNGFKIAHGGITYSLADSALAFASNSHGRQAVSVETSISHTYKVVAGDILTAIAEEQHRSDKIGVYQIKVTNREDKIVAIFKGVVYRTQKDW